MEKNVLYYTHRGDYMDIDGIYYCSRCMRKVEYDAQTCPHCGYDPASTAANSQHLAEGTFLNDRYLLGAVIGAGGFGVTYAAWDENLSVPVRVVLSRVFSHFFTKGVLLTPLM